MPEDKQQTPSEVDIDEYLEKWNEENELPDEEDVAEAPDVEENEGEEDAPVEDATASDGAEAEGEESEDDAEPKEAAETAEDATTGEEPGDGAAASAEAAASEESSNEAAPGDAQPTEEETRKAFYEKISADISEISKVYPDVKELKDIGDEKDVKTFVLLTTFAGKSPTKAYELIKEKAQTPPAPKEVGPSKAHLKSSVPKGASEEGGSLTDRQARELAEDLGISEKEVRKYYKRVSQ